MTKTFIKFTLALLFATLIFNSCQQQSKEEKEEKTQTDGQADLPWLKNAVIYEVNLRQFSASGKFKDFEARLDSIKKLGVDILWFMPLQPIGLKTAKVP
jgi:1,4-alpha-glucan branching enzyme